MRVVTGRRGAAGLAMPAGLMALAALVVPLAVQAGPASADPGPAPPSRQRTILNDVHTDVLDVQYVDGQLKLQTRMGNPPYEYLPASDVLFQLKDIDGVSRFPVPDAPEFAFLGPVGSPVWIAPQDFVPPLIYPGWDTESLLPGTLAGDAVDIRLISATGPGNVEVFQVGSVGEPLRVFSSQDPDFRTLHQGVGSHAHANWAFSALGRYTLTFEATGADLSGQPLNSGPVAYTWYVGGTQAGDVPALSSATTLSVSPPSAEVGQPVTLTGAVAPAEAPGWLEFLDGATVLGHSAVSGGQAALTTTALAAGEHELTARFVPANTTDFQPSTSPPLAYQVTGTGTTTTTSTTASTATTTSTTEPTTTTTSGTTSTTNPTTTTSCVPVTNLPASGGVVLADGHVDYGTRIVNGALVSQVKDGTVATTTTWREPARVVFHVVPAAATTVPANGFDFIGNPGDRFWQIPQTQRAGILWLGWNTQEISTAQIRGGITWSLDRLEGPGKMSIFVFDPFGEPEVLFNSGDGVGDRYEIPLGTHAHGNWAFTKEGVYRATFTQSATLASGARVSDTEVVTFAVGAVNPNSALPAGTEPQNNSGACPGDDTNASRLALTGATLATPLVIGGLLVLTGVLIVVILRRRRSTSTVDGQR